MDLETTVLHGVAGACCICIILLCGFICEFGLRISTNYVENVTELLAYVRPVDTSRSSPILPAPGNEASPMRCFAMQTVMARLGRKTTKYTACIILFLLLRRSQRKEGTRRKGPPEGTRKNQRKARRSRMSPQLRSQRKARRSWNQHPPESHREGGHEVSAEDRGGLLLPW